MAASKNSDRRQLVLIFGAWKALLFLLAAFCPGPGYDTSGLILTDASTNRYANFEQWSRFDRAMLSFFRWDGLYFVKAAERSVIYEQEWAFSPAYSWLMGIMGRSISTKPGASVRSCIAAGVVISTFCHLLSVLVLYRLVTLLTRASHQQSRVAFLACVLHTLAPAGLFLSAPYAESIFSLLNFAGMLCYAESKMAARSASISSQEVVYRLSSGVLFALATIVRSNGLLSGLVLLYDVLLYLPRLLSIRPSVQDLCRVVVTCVSGTLIAIGFIGPQYVAYLDFCSTETSVTRPWCEKSIPSIYSWVQSHYWNVGLFRYWTLSNVPLFLLALPMVWLLVFSSVTIFRIGRAPLLRGRTVPHTGNMPDTKHKPPIECDIPELALPQLVLALAAATSFHVQIINRISSGYPMWYLTVAAWLLHDQNKHIGHEMHLGQWAVRGMIMYSMVQEHRMAHWYY